MNELPEFVSWPKIPRWENDHVIITEKLDGTNAQILITPFGEVFTGSRNQWITPEKDNYGFARWVQENIDEVRKLGHGRHYGEWYGQGIQRTYNLPTKRFALFNTFRPPETLPEGIEIVPILYQGIFQEELINEYCSELINKGSRASPNFMSPEGICIYWKQSKRIHKCIINK